MHTVNARLFTVADCEVGTRLLYEHGVGYVPATVTNVRTKERKRTDPTTLEVVEVGVETHFGVQSETGSQTGSAFYPDFLPAEQRGRDFGARFLVPDPDGPLVASVLDYIGCTSAGSGFTVFTPQTDPVLAEAAVREALDEYNITVVGGLTMRPVTEQRVACRDDVGGPITRVCYEHEAGFGLMEYVVV